MNNQNKELTDKDERAAKKLKLILKQKSERTVNGVVWGNAGSATHTRDDQARRT